MGLGQNGGAGSAGSESSSSGGFRSMSQSHCQHREGGGDGVVHRGIEW